MKIQINSWIFSSAITIVYGLIHLYSDILFELTSTNKLLFDDFDSNLILWIFERNYLSIKSYDLINFWNAASFFPHENTLSYSESILSGQLFYFPLRLIGLNPVACLNLTLISIMILSVISLDFTLIRYYKYTLIERILFILISLFSLTIVNFFGHYQFVIFQLTPTFFLIFFAYLNNPSNKKLILLALLFSFITFYSTYFAPMAVTISILTTIFYYKFNFKKYILIIKSLNIKNDKRWLYLSILVIFILYVIQIKPYTLIPKLDSFMSYMEVAAAYSARPWSIIQASKLSVIYPGFEFNFINYWGYWERSYFPGVLVIISIVLFIVLKANGSLSYKEYNNVKVYLIFLILLYLLSLGPLIKIPSSIKEHLKINDELANIKIFLPFYYLSKFFPGLENIRAPGRFGMMMTCGFAFITIYVINNITYKTKKKNVIYFFILIFFMIENQINVPVYQYEDKNKKFFSNIEKIIQKNDSTLTLPFTKSDHMETIKNYMDILNASNIHGGRVVAGYGARSTKEIGEIAHIDNEYKASRVEIEDIINWSVDNQIKYLIVLDSSYIDDLYKSENKAYTRLYSDKEGSLYKIK